MSRHLIAQHLGGLHGYELLATGAVVLIPFLALAVVLWSHRARRSDD